MLPESVQAAVPLGGRFRIYAVNPPYPRFDPDTWRLEIDGMVERPVSLSLAELKALPTVEQTSDFHCVTGWTVRGVRWRGVRFSELMKLVTPRPGASALHFVSTEVPYDDSLSFEQLRAPDALLAWDLDDAPLTREQGAPVRVIMPQMFAYKGAKWLGRIEVTDRVADGYWQLRGYDRDAWIDGARRS